MVAAVIKACKPLSEQHYLVRASLPSCYKLEFSNTVEVLRALCWQQQTQ